MRFVWVTVSLKEVYDKKGSDSPSQMLENIDEQADLSVAVSQAKEFLGDQESSAATNIDKFKSLIGIYSFSIPIFIGFLSPRLATLPRLFILILGFTVLIPGFCIYKFFTVRTFISIMPHQGDINKKLQEQQIGQINGYLQKGDSIIASNNFNVNLYYSAYRWVAIALFVLLGLTLWLPASAPQKVTTPINNFFFPTMIPSIQSNQTSGDGAAKKPEAQPAPKSSPTPIHS